MKLTYNLEAIVSAVPKLTVNKQTDRQTDRQSDITNSNMK